jgi:hypothetical protein
MVCILIDDWIYMDEQGKVGIYGRQEFNRNYKSSLKTGQVAFLDYQTKLLNFEDPRSSYQEVLINAAFDNSFMIAQERFSDHLAQVIGAKKEVIEDIYRYFTGIRVQRLIPYAVAVRAFLHSKERLSSNQWTVFLDDLKNQAVLTIFKGSTFNESRKISMRDPQYMIAEIKRSWQGLNTEAAFTLVSNNQEWLSVFVEQGFLPKEDIVHVNSEFPVLEGLKSAQFAIHFAPVEQILREKKRRLWKERIAVLGVGFLLIVLGVVSYLVMHSDQVKELKQQQLLRARESSLKESLRSLYPLKALSLLTHDKPIAYAKIYFNFVTEVSSEWIVESIRMAKDDQGVFQFEGDIFPKDQNTIEEGFNVRGDFSEARVEEIILNKSLGKRIMFQVDQRGR